MQEAVVLEAAAAEQRVEGVHGLVARHALGERPVDVGRALGRQRVRVGQRRQLDVPARARSPLYSAQLDEPDDAAKLYSCSKSNRAVHDEI